MPTSSAPFGNESVSGSRYTRTRGRDGAHKSVVACDRCRVKKIKCDGTASCRSCAATGVSCFYSRSVRRYRGSSIAKTQNLQRRLGDAERLLQSAGLLEQLRAPVEDSDVAAGRVSPQLAQNTHRFDAESIHRTAQSHDSTLTDNSYEAPHTNLGSNEAQSHATGRGTSQRSVPTVSSRFSPSFLGSDTCTTTAGFTLPVISTPSPSTVDGGLTHVPSKNPHACPGHIISLSNENDDRVDAGESCSRDEVHGPHSYLSICADPGVHWIASRIGASDYATCATALTSAISRKLKLRERLSPERIPDPPEDTAWQYTNAYFNDSFEATFNTISKSSFETRLRRHLDDPLSDVDPGWYALRNIVFASGCRIESFKSCPWIEAQTRAQGYFDNALSVEVELLHGTPGLLAIQALLLMALFTEGLGGAKLEFMLISCAVRLAHARGLHLRPSSTVISFEDTQRRSWIFWTIYCLEKHLTLRAGRPSAIDDDDISCDLPTWMPHANPHYIDCFKQIVSQAMLSSAIAKSFTTVKARQRSLVEKAELVKDFDAKLQSWYGNLPAHFRLRFPLEANALPQGVRTEHIMYLHLSYHGNLAAIHSILGHPWNLSTAPSHDQYTSVVEKQIKCSNEALTEASRNIIMITRSIVVDAVAPIWLLFYYPLLGMINMFISILKTPASESTVSDIAAIDIAAGYFAYLDYSTNSILSFALVRNLAQWARQAVTKASTSPPESEPMPFAVEAEIAVPMQDVYTHSVSEMGTFDVDGMSLGDWPAFFPRLPLFTTWS